MNKLATTAEKFKTTCSYCGVGCGIIVHRSSNGSIQVEGDPDHHVNKGMLYSKWMNSQYVVDDKTDRLLYPPMRWSSGYDWERVDWNTALGREAALFKSIIQKHDPDAVAFYI